MRRLALLALAPLALAAPAQAQDPHAGHVIPAQAPPPAADPHAGHTMPAAPPPSADPHAGHIMPAAPATTGTAPPPIPTDFEADRHYPRAAMDAAREVLRREHGAVTWSKVMVEKLEVRPGDGKDGYAWEGRASFGGDINRFVLKSEGEGAGDVEAAEVQALYSRAIAPFFDLQAGVRQDFEPRGRTYATVGVDGVAPSWFELEAAVFLSDRGDVTARIEGAYDFRLTQKLILEPRVEANLSAQDAPSQAVGAGLTDVELGLRLRYAVTPQFAPYVGVNYERKFGDTADFARAAGEDAHDTRLVVGVRAWF